MFSILLTEVSAAKADAKISIYYHINKSRAILFLFFIIYCYLCTRYYSLTPAAKRLTHNKPQSGLKNKNIEYE